MKDFLETTLGRVILGVIVLVIWGVNAINISAIKKDDEVALVQEVQQIDMAELVVPEKIQYQYIKNSRDPFREPNYQPESQIEKEPEIKKEPEVPFPTLTLNGIVEGMAVISDTQGFTHLVKRNDTFLQNIYVMHIWADSVLLEYNDKKYTLKLN